MLTEHISSYVVYPSTMPSNSFSMSCMHIPGVDNGVADALSWNNITLVYFVLPQASLEHIGDPQRVGLLIDQGVADSTLRYIVYFWQEALLGVLQPLSLQTSIGR